MVTNNHYDSDGALSLFTMLRPEVALLHRDLMLRAARAGDFAVWGGADALALELGIMSDLGPFMPFSTPPFDEERLGNLASAYLRLFDRLESLLADPFALRSEWAQRYDQVVTDVARIEAGKGVSVTEYAEDDLALVETDRPITTFGLRLAAGDLFRVLLVHPGANGNRYRFCFRGSRGGTSSPSDRSRGWLWQTWPPGSTSSKRRSRVAGGRPPRTGPSPSWASVTPSPFGIKPCASIRRRRRTHRARYRQTWS